VTPASRPREMSKDDAMTTIRGVWCIKPPRRRTVSVSRVRWGCRSMSHLACSAA